MAVGRGGIRRGGAANIPQKMQFFPVRGDFPVGPIFACFRARPRHIGNEHQGTNIVLRLIQSKSVRLTTVDLDGKLIGPWVDEVRATVATLRRDQAVCLNLIHLSFADTAGFRLLCEMRRDGVQLVGVSPLIEGLLEHHRDRSVNEAIAMDHEISAGPHRSSEASKRAAPAAGELERQSCGEQRGCR